MFRYAFSGFATVALGLLLVSCGGTDVDGAISTGVAQTQQISQLETAAAGAGMPAQAQEAQQEENTSAAPAAAEEKAPEATDVPTIMLTPTMDIPFISVSVDTNCRSGPALNYGHKTTINAGQSMKVVGVPADPKEDEYVLVEYGNNGAICWLWLKYADKQDFSAYQLSGYDTPTTPVPPFTATPTPTATPAFDWSGTWQIWALNCGPCSANFVVAGNNVTGGFTIMPIGTNVTLSGTISNGGQNLSGTWASDTPANGIFQFQITSSNLNQFRGNLDGNLQWCGAKNGASQPSPCQWP